MVHLEKSIDQAFLPKKSDNPTDPPYKRKKHKSTFDAGSGK